MRLLALTALIFALLAPTASARWFGSTLKGKANADYGCETAITSGTFGIQRSATNQRSCTYRHGGYLNKNRFTFVAPGTGRVTRIRVKTPRGGRPAKLRLTVLTGSSRVDPFTGRDQPGTY